MDLTTPAGIQSLLSSTPYACTSLVPLTGGSAGLTFRGTLVTPLKGGSRTVVVKHAEDFPLPENLRLDATRLVGFSFTSTAQTLLTSPRQRTPGF